MKKKSTLIINQKMIKIYLSGHIRRHVAGVLSSLIEFFPNATFVDTWEDANLVWKAVHTSLSRYTRIKDQKHIFSHLKGFEQYTTKNFTCAWSPLTGKDILTMPSVEYVIFKHIDSFGGGFTRGGLKKPHQILERGKVHFTSINYIIQEYITDPVVDEHGRKMEYRIYVLFIDGIKRIVLKSGVIRHASKKFTMKCLSDPRIHMVNQAVNDHRKDLLTFVPDIDILKCQNIIDDLVPAIIFDHQINRFEILAFDILPTKHGNRLIEINRDPTIFFPDTTREIITYLSEFYFRP